MLELVERQKRVEWLDSRSQNYSVTRNADVEVPARSKPVQKNSDDADISSVFLSTRDSMRCLFKPTSQRSNSNQQW